MDDCIFVKYQYGTYAARYKGKTASATAGPELAAKCVAEKVLGVLNVKIACAKEGCGAVGRYAFRILKENQEPETDNEKPVF